VKRTGFFGCMVALCLVLGACGKGEHDSELPATASGASTVVQPGETRGNERGEQRNEARIDAPGGAAPVVRDSTGDTVALEQLPKQAVVTLRRIEAGGPFPFEKDGIVFGNRERLLPPHPRGFYREYTVPTPRARDRGARRIVCGGPRRQIDNCYYSDDHYASFKRIAG
jgi:ribonuclease T1